MFISYKNFGMNEIHILFQSGEKLSTKNHYGFKDGLEKIRELHKMFGIEQANFVDAETGEIIAEIWPDSRES